MLKPSIIGSSRLLDGSSKMTCLFLASSWCRHRKADSQLKFSLFYGLSFVANAFVMPFGNVFLRQVGWTGTQIGLLSLVQQLLGFVAAPMVGALADRFHSHRLVVLLTVIATPFVQLAVAFAGSSQWLMWLVTTLCTLVRAGTVPICDRSIVRLLQQQGKASQYGRVRMFGAVGWGLGSVAIGLLVDQFDGNLAVSYVAQAIWTVVFVFPLLPWLDWPVEVDLKRAVCLSAESTDAAVAIVIDAAPAADVSDEKDALLQWDGRLKWDEGSAKHAHHVQSSAASSGVALPETRPETPKGKLLSMDTAIFMTIVLIQGTLMGIIGTAQFLFLNDLGASTTLLGGSLLVTCVAEVPFFFFSEWVVKRLSSHGVLLLAGSCLALRLWMYSLLPILPMLELILPVELLHGVTFALMWAGAVAFAAHVSPPHLESTVQAVMGGLYFGAGSAIGGAVGGWAYSHYGGQVLFGAAAYVTVAICVLHALTLGVRALSQCCCEASSPTANVTPMAAARSDDGSPVVYQTAVLEA